MSVSYKERFERLRNFQSRDFWAMIFARPLTILLLLPIIELKFITPDVVTVFSFLFKAAGCAALVFWPSYAGGAAAAVMINLGLVLDNKDGTIARYRKCGTMYGSFLDKACDAFAITLIFGSFGLRVFLAGGKALDIVVPLLGACGIYVTWYCDYVKNKLLNQLEMKRRLQNGTWEELAAKTAAPDAGVKPPRRTVSQWIVWALKAVLSIVNINEVDIYFFLAVALVFDVPWLFVYPVSIVYGAQALILVPKYFIQVYTAEKNLG